MQVAIDPPRFDLAPGVVDRQELAGIQAVVAKPTVERLDDAYFHWLSETDTVGRSPRRRTR